MPHAEALPVSGTTLANLDTAPLTDYLLKLAEDTETPSTVDDWEQRLTSIGLLAARERIYVQVFHRASATETSREKATRKT